MNILKTLGIDIFSKEDFVVGMLSATIFLLFTGQAVGAILLGVLATVGFSMIKEYFSWERIKNTVSSAYTSIKEKIFPPSFDPGYSAMPENGPYHDKNGSQIKTSFSQDNLLSANSDQKRFDL